MGEIKHTFNHQKIFFDEESHAYFNMRGEELLSVSHLISQFKPPFDPNGDIIKRCAARDGVTVEELRKKWDNIRDEASDKGHKFHTDAEYFIKTGKIKRTVNSKIIKQLRHIGLKGRLFPEQIVASTKHRVAGTVDLIEVLPNSHVNIWDYKTNKRLEKKSWRGEYMLPPVNHLHNCNFNHYTLQLSIYAFLLEEYGYWINNLKILYINPKTEIIEPHIVQFRRQDVLNILHIHSLNLLINNE